MTKRGDSDADAPLGLEGEELTFESAISEVERIVQTIEEDEIDIDSLAPSVERAGELLRFCREKLAKTELEVLEAVAGLGDSEEESGS